MPARTWSRIGAALMLLALAGAGACGDDSGGGNGGAGGFGGGDAANGFGASACYACESAACAAPRADCTANPDCAGYLSCLEACPTSGSGNVDPACRAACPTPGSSEGVSRRDALETCFAASGCSACGASGSDSGTSDATADAANACAFLDQTCEPSSESDPCQRCLREECCDSVAVVYQSGAPGYELGICLNACNGAYECKKQCYAQHPDGIPSLGEMTGCYRANCDPALDCVKDIPCGRCLYRECGCEHALCLRDPECVQVNECLGQCSAADVQCTNACRNEHPAAQPLLDAVGACILLHCKSECGAT